MDFGKLPSVDNVNFSLPPDPPQNAAVLGALLPRTSPPAVFLGATGYNMKPWVGKWYPPGTKDKEFLTHYGRQFNTIEHNTTHYRIPDTATVARWCEEVPADFRYCPKIPQAISHARDLGVRSRELPLFCEAIQGLGNKLGCCFIQLPPHFSVQQLPVLARFLEVFPATEIPLAVEVRHPSFFEASVASDDYFQLLHELDVSTVVTDVAGRRDVCHMRLSTGRVLIRFVGNDLHPSDHTRAADWAARLAQWFERGLREAYFFCHEPDNLLAPDLAVLAGEMFSKVIPEVVLRIPAPYRPAAEQGRLF